jgi:hypothetical protein
MIMIYAKFVSFDGNDLVLVVQLTDFYMESVRRLASDKARFPSARFHPDDEEGTTCDISVPTPWVELLRGNEQSSASVREILANADRAYADYPDDYSQLAWDFDYLEPTGFDAFSDFLNAVQLVSGEKMDYSFEVYLTHVVVKNSGVLELGYCIADGNGQLFDRADVLVDLFPE